MVSGTTEDRSTLDADLEGHMPTSLPIVYNRSALFRQGSPHIKADELSARGSSRKETSSRPGYGQGEHPGSGGDRYGVRAVQDELHACVEQERRHWEEELVADKILQQA
jgi:hypothetical protein